MLFFSSTHQKQVLYNEEEEETSAMTRVKLYLPDNTTKILCIHKKTYFHTLRTELRKLNVDIGYDYFLTYVTNGIKRRIVGNDDIAKWQAIMVHDDEPAMSVEERSAAEKPNQMYESIKELSVYGSAGILLLVFVGNPIAVCCRVAAGVLSWGLLVYILVALLDGSSQDFLRAVFGKVERTRRLFRSIYELSERDETSLIEHVDPAPNVQPVPTETKTERTDSADPLVDADGRSTSSASKVDQQPVPEVGIQTQSPEQHQCRLGKVCKSHYPDPISVKPKPKRSVSIYDL